MSRAAVLRRGTRCCRRLRQYRPSTIRATPQRYRAPAPATAVVPVRVVDGDHGAGREPAGGPTGDVVTGPFLRPGRVRTPVVANRTQASAMSRPACDGRRSTEDHRPRGRGCPRRRERRWWQAPSSPSKAAAFGELVHPHHDPEATASSANSMAGIRNTQSVNGVEDVAAAHRAGAGTPR
jgi:hypothetical protein